MSWCTGSGHLLFSFDVTHSVEKEPELTFVYSGRRNELVRGYSKHKAVFPDFPSDKEFVAYLQGGLELMFTDEGDVARGQKFVCRLI